MKTQFSAETTDDEIRAWKRKKLSGLILLNDVTLLIKTFCPIGRVFPDPNHSSNERQLNHNLCPTRRDWAEQNVAFV